MNADNFSIDMLLAMRHSPVRNYIVPGLTSWLIGSPGENGLVRLFESSREQQEFITPHSHRFDFQSWILKGSVVNRLWHRGYSPADMFYAKEIEYRGAIGQYEEVGGEAQYFKYEDKSYSAGECYAMTHKQIHSINFSRNALVLIFEGPQKTNRTTVLEPWVNGLQIPTMQVQPWMFQKD